MRFICWPHNSGHICTWNPFLPSNQNGTQSSLSTSNQCDGRRHFASLLMTNMDSAPSKINCHQTSCHSDKCRRAIFSLAPLPSFLLWWIKWIKINLFPQKDFEILSTKDKKKLSLMEFLVSFLSAWMENFTRKRKWSWQLVRRHLSENSKPFYEKVYRESNVGFEP